MSRSRTSLYTVEPTSYLAISAKFAFSVYLGVENVEAKVTRGYGTDPVRMCPEYERSRPLREGGQGPDLLRYERRTPEKADRYLALVTVSAVE